ncbi:MAG: NUDIX hydrolase [Microgenomates group bacterium]
MTWQKISSTEKYKNRYMTVTEDEVVTDYDDHVMFGIVHKKPGASIIPWDGQYFTIVGQYRYPVDYFSWEFPAGHFEHENMESTARAELEEEAGLLAGKIEKIGEFHLGPGHHTQIIHFFLATELSQGKQNLETAEKGMQIKKVTHEELNQMIKSGEVKDSLTIAALKFFELYLANK